MKERIEKYLELTKPKVTLLNLLVGITCFTLAAFPSVDPLKLAIFSLAGYLACGGCGALNSVYDHDTDKIMERTSRRAIPSGAITPRRALLFGFLLTGAGVSISYLSFNMLTAFMMVLGAAFYLGVYTVLLKRTTSWNVVIGGAAGCFAAFSGWTAVANSLSLAPLLISTVDFLWTPGHLWGLGMKKIKEYRNAGIPMLPVVAGLKRTVQAIFVFNLATVSSTLIFPAVGLTGWVYLVVAVSAGVWFTLETVKVVSSPSGSRGFRVFLVSIPYLAVLMSGLLLDKIVVLS